MKFVSSIRMRFPALRIPGCYVLLPNAILLSRNALRALGNNTWGDNATLLSVSLGEGLLARLSTMKQKHALHLPEQERSSRNLCRPTRTLLLRSVFLD